MTINIVRLRLEDKGEGSGGGTVDSNVKTGVASVGLDSGVACTDAGEGAEADGVSCKLASDNGLGAVRSNVDAAQSQWVEREWEML